MNDDPVQQVGRWLGWSAVGLLLTALTGISLISMGLFDPPQVGTKERVIPLNQTITTNEGHLEWLDEPPLGETFTVQLAAAYTIGEQDSGYGLALGSPDDYLVVAVSPAGYVMVSSERLAVRNGQLAGGSENLKPETWDLKLKTLPLPWQLWPHVRRGEQVNLLRVTMQGADVAIRINGELLWQGPWAGRGRALALYLTSYNQPVTITFQELRIWE
ncbi:MAG: hypothetical protein KJ063_02655 [Anaerolineae bacterium]|nr:hypothetical protein [Anaerolineae bacterium]